MMKLLIVVVALLVASSAFAQTPTLIVDPMTAAGEFNSVDHTNTITYRASLWPDGTTDFTGPPIATGIDVPASAVTTVSPGLYRLTFVQMGLATKIPACTVVAPGTCPVYRALLQGIGTDKVPSAPAVAVLSNPFGVAPKMRPPVVGPTNVSVKPQ
jgi:hypothetical protein